MQIAKIKIDKKAINLTKLYIIKFCDQRQAAANVKKSKLSSALINFSERNEDSVIRL